MMREVRKVQMDAPTEQEFDECQEFLNWLKEETEKFGSFSRSGEDIEEFEEQLIEKLDSVDFSFRRIMLACSCLLEEES